MPPSKKEQILMMMKMLSSLGGDLDEDKEEERKYLSRSECNKLFERMQLEAPKPDVDPFKFLFELIKHLLYKCEELEQELNFIKDSIATIDGKETFKYIGIKKDE